MKPQEDCTNCVNNWRRLKEIASGYIAAFALGAAAMLYICQIDKKPDSIVIESVVFAPEDAARFNRVWSEICAVRGDDNSRLKRALVDAVSQGKPEVPSENMKCLDEVLNVYGQLYKLVRRYDGSESPPALTPDNREEFDTFRAFHRAWFPFVHALIDENNDGKYSELETRVAYYKISRP